MNEESLRGLTIPLLKSLACNKKFLVRIMSNLAISDSFFELFKFKNQREYQQWSASNNRPQNIPGSPYGYYKKTGEWISWGDWLGTQTIATKYLKK